MYQARSDPAVGGPTKIDWRLSFDDFATSQPEQIVARHVRQPSWRRDQRGGISITRVVGKRVIGTILAEYTLLNPGGNDARFEAVLRSSSRRTFTPWFIWIWSSLGATTSW